MAFHTDRPLDQIQNDTDRDFFMSAVEAQAYGLIDQVVVKRPEHAVAA
jgi:ATP-dependent Clp protease protease subunit